MITRYSPKPLSEYTVAAMSRFLASDMTAWNLCYLSVDWEKSTIPDPMITVHVRRSLQFIPFDGTIDLTGKQTDATLRAQLDLCNPVQAVHLIRALKHLDKLPLFVAYGKPWLDLIEQRCRMWREPYDEAHDFKVGDLSSAQAILQKF